MSRTISEIAMTCVSQYMQSWGQTAEDRTKALNDAAEAAGLQCRFKQGPNGEKAGWYGDDSERGVKFRAAIDDCWRGRFEDEQAAVEAVIRRFQGETTSVPSSSDSETASS